jgi:uncharacterized membrane protein YbhN (UPF0104 family)
VSTTEVKAEAKQKVKEAQAELPDEFQPRSLVRRLIPVVALIAAITLAVLLAPGLHQVRSRLGDAEPGWLAVGVLLELLSSLSYVAMFRPVFCRRMPWRTSWQIGWSELGMGSLVPASGAGGLALGAWILNRQGMPGGRIARRSVAFFLIKSSVNFVAVAVIGTAMALHLVGPHLSPLLTALPAAMSVLLIAVVLLVPRLGPGQPPPRGAGRFRILLVKARDALVLGTAEAKDILREHDWLVIAGAIGYWAFDNAVLWATFHAFGEPPALTIILMGYLIGQIGGLLPLPGGVGGIDGGLLGTLIVYGAPAALTAAAVLAYRVILFWLPLLIGAPSFLWLQRELRASERPLAEARR